MQSIFSKIAFGIAGIITMLSAGTSNAQVSFSLPAHTATQPLSAAEYFYDTDPGRGNGTTIALGTGTDINTSLAANISGLAKGAHRLFVRSRNSSGEWSAANSLVFVSYTLVNALPAAVSGSQQVTAAEYFVDTDPGPGNGVGVALPAVGADVTASNIGVNVSSLSLGIHRVYFRSRNADGKWSLASGSTFTILVGSLSSLPAHTGGKLVSSIEYFVDNDPGYGNGTIISVTPTADLVNQTFAADISTLADGPHTLFIRSLNGRSLTTAKSFQIGGVALPIKWLSVDGWLQGDKVAITWSAGEEKDCREYVIERSGDGRIFSPTGTVSRFEDAAAAHSYSFSDRQPLEGSSYYRIMQRDISGKTSYSPVISIRKGATAAEIRINNPVSNTLTIKRLGEEAEAIELSVFNTTGVEVMHIASSNEVIQQVDVSGLPPGMYLLHQKTGGKALSFIKQ
jgi:hypothetical protein